jgi:type IV pilus assembly protein PilX
MKYAIQNSQPRQQSGVTLIVGLIMLLLITMIGVNSMQDTGMQERMTMNVRDKNVAFQAAETALRAAEDSLKVASLSQFNNSNGYLADGTMSSPHDADYLANTFNWNTYGATTLSVDDVESPPKWVIEHLSSDVCGEEGAGASLAAKGPNSECDLFRITSRSFGMTSNTQAILQSTIRR